MIFILILGCFMDGMGMILLTIPVVFPIAKALGVDPLHFGVLMTINVELGTITPPVGFNLYAVSGIGKISVDQVLRGVLPFFLAMLGFLFFMIFMPDLCTWLPGLIFKPIQFGG
jgi:C4-dicarboxylate transporter DctM subunit